jgi:3-oxoacyl-[acyl-carrier-protein] synthase-1
VAIRTNLGIVDNRAARGGILKPDNGAVVITGIGMASSLAMDAANACAAARAGITRSGELKCMNFAGASCFGRETPDGVPIFTGHASTIRSGFTGKARLALLGSAALNDLLTTTSLTPSELASCGLKVNMSDQFIEQANEARREVGEVPEQFEYPASDWRAEAEQVVSMFLQRSGAAVGRGPHALYLGGHAGFAEAVRCACQDLRAGKVERCIVGAVDS